MHRSTTAHANRLPVGRACRRTRHGSSHHRSMNLDGNQWHGPNNYMHVICKMRIYVWQFVERNINFWPAEARTRCHLRSPPPPLPPLPPRAHREQPAAGGRQRRAAASGAAPLIRIMSERPRLEAAFRQARARGRRGAALILSSQISPCRCGGNRG